MSRLPDNWAFATVNETLDILDNFRRPINARDRDKRLRNASKTYSYYGATGQVGLIDDYLLEGQSILLGEDGAPFFEPYENKAYLVDGQYWVNNHAHILRGKKGIENAFICHQLNALDYHGYVAGTTRLKLTQASLKNIKLRLVPTKEQKRIVEKIEELFSKIDAGEAALKKAQALIKQYRQSLLKAAVTGELTHEWRVKNKGKIEPAHKLLEHILEARRNAFNGKGKYKAPLLPDVSNLPQLPEGWVWATLDQISDITGGVTVDGKRKVENGISVPYLRVANVQRGYLDLTEIKKIHVDEETAQKLYLKKGDILFNEGGDLDKLGRGWIWSGEIEMCIHQNHVFRARRYTDDTSSKIISWYTNVLGRPFFMGEGKQTTNLASISLSKLRSFPVPIPPKKEAVRIEEILEYELSLVDNLSAYFDKESVKPNQLRQSILKSAFSGQLVEQDPTDEPASVLLERIKAEREKTNPSATSETPKAQKRKKAA